MRIVPSFVLRTETVAWPLAAEPVATATVATTAIAASRARRADRALMEDLPWLGWGVPPEDAGAEERSIGGGLRSRVATTKGAPVRDAPRDDVALSRELLQLDARAGLLELALELVRLVALDALLDGLRSLVDERLGLLQAQAGRRADDLDHLDLLVARAGEDAVARRADFLPGGAATAVAGGRGRGGDRRRRDAELLLERLDALGQLEPRDALQLVDPLLGRSHVVPPVASVVSGLRRSVRLVVVGRVGVLRAALGGLLGRGRLGRRLGGPVRGLLPGAARPPWRRPRPRRRTRRARWRSRPGPRRPGPPRRRRPARPRRRAARPPGAAGGPSLRAPWLGRMPSP